MQSDLAAMTENHRRECAAHADTAGKLKNTEHDFLMYSRAWERELKPPFVQKSHRIDALVMTTQLRLKERDDARAELKLCQEAVVLKDEALKAYEDAHALCGAGSGEYIEKLQQQAQQRFDDLRKAALAVKVKP